VTLPLTVVLATRNPGKAREFARLLGAAFSLSTVPESISLPEETGRTFAENARLKAEEVFGALHMQAAVLADDSGLQVAALGGEPGVQSARYAGDHASDEQNVQKLLTALVGHTKREARFVCALHFILPALQPGPGSASRAFTAEGLLEGKITHFPRGQDGFGYDPVFEPAGWRETLAEARPVDKDAVSHRGAAARALLARLREGGVIKDGS
jgi:non-canonical purine NTP pyrophosphatase (RdgB/HAM1 family)